jgi:hypothetical protein
MTQEAVVGVNDLAHLQQRFEEFRNGRPTRGRLPAGLWKEAAEAARRFGLNPTAQALRLDYNRLKKHMATPPGPVKRTKQVDPVPAFVELIGAIPQVTTDCRIEVESDHGAKLRLELKGVATSELVSLIRGFTASK